MSLSGCPEASQNSFFRLATHDDNDNRNGNSNLAGPEKTDFLSIASPPIPKSAFQTALRSIDSRWFLVPQGTGILAVALWELPYQFSGLNIIAIIFWILTICLFVLILVLYVLRGILFSRYYTALFSTNTTEVACLASVVISFSSIVQMLGLLLDDNGWSVVTYVLWWICMGLSLLLCISIPYVFAHVNPPGIAQLLPSSQLPLVAVITAAAIGGSLCQAAVLGASLQVPAIMVSYLLLGLAMPLALILDALFLARLYNHTKADWPTGARTEALGLAYQTLVLVGPWGQCSSALQSLGQAILNANFTQYNQSLVLASQATPVIGHISIFAGVISWGHATFWWAFTIINIIHVLSQNKRAHRDTQFDLAAWSMVFPWGVYTHAAEQLGHNLDSSAFKLWSTVLAVLMVIIWLLNTIFTIKGCVTGTLLGLNPGWQVSKTRETA